MSRDYAFKWIEKLHRHHAPPPGAKLVVSCANEAGDIVGVATLGRPVARMLDDGTTAEVTRVATDGTPNACSFLYGACRRIAKELGYKRVLTYTLAEEPGTSLKAAGWKQTTVVRGRSWSCPSRPRVDKHPTVDKQRWECELG